MLHVILELASVFVKTDDLLRNVNTHAFSLSSLLKLFQHGLRPSTLNVWSIFLKGHLSSNQQC